MVLSYSGIQTHPDDLVDSVYVPEKKGSFAIELRAAARTHGRLPYKIKPSLQSLSRVLEAGYPVLIMQNVGLGFAPVWHFAVTIGYDRSKDSFILRTGPERRLEMTSVKFLRRWRLADYWAVILLDPDDFPAWLDEEQYEQQLSLLEQSWAPHLASIYTKMQARWPGSIMARLGLGNIAYNNGDTNQAVGYYQSVLRLDPNHIATLHNLAGIYLERNNIEAAAKLACRAKGLSQNHPLRPYVMKLEQEIRAKDPRYECPGN